MLDFRLKLILIAAVLLIVQWLVVGTLLRRVAPWSRVLPPTGISPDTWNQILVAHPSATKLLGCLECLLAFGSFFALDKKDAALVLGGWLAFKVGSKWEAWQNLIKVPETLTNIPEVEFLRARHQWGATLYQRMLIGSLLNFFLGFAAAVMARMWLS